MEENEEQEEMNEVLIDVILSPMISVGIINENVDMRLMLPLISTEDIEQLSNDE